MSKERIRRLSEPVPARQADQKAVRRQLAWAAGAESFSNRDPLHHVTEFFGQTFDLMGMRHAGRFTGGGDASGQGKFGGMQSAQQPDISMPDKTDTHGFYERKSPEEQDMLRRFSETAFQRGSMSASVLKGSGKMMLFSCLKKTVGQAQPDKWQQRKLFEQASVHRNVPGHNPDKVIFNRGFTDSAIGIVVDALRDSRRIVEGMTALAQGKSEMGEDSGAGTLNKMYPFLSDEKERGLLEQYSAQLRELSPGDTKRAILQGALVRTRALISKKAQMKAEFINKLRFISDRAAEALEEFEQPDFSTQLGAALIATLADEPPPDESDEGDNTRGKGSAEQNADSNADPSAKA